MVHDAVRAAAPPPLNPSRPSSSPRPPFVLAVGVRRVAAPFTSVGELGAQRRNTPTASRSAMTFSAFPRRRLDPGWSVPSQITASMTACACHVGDTAEWTAWHDLKPRGVAPRARASACHVASRVLFFCASGSRRRAAALVVFACGTRRRASHDRTHATSPRR